MDVFDLATVETTAFVSSGSPTPSNRSDKECTLFWVQLKVLLFAKLKKSENEKEVSFRRVSADKNIFRPSDDISPQVVR